MNTNKILNEFVDSDTVKKLITIVVCKDFSISDLKLVWQKISLSSGLTDFYFHGNCYSFTMRRSFS